jgi:hypothetical protein
MRLLFGSALVVALGVAACGGNDGGRSGTDPADVPSTSTAPPSSEPEPPLRRPKPGVPLSITPPPIKPQSGPTEPVP